MSDETQERRQGATGTWTKLLETCDEHGTPVIVATPDWSSNSWPFALSAWCALPLVETKGTQP